MSDKAEKEIMGLTLSVEEMAKIINDVSEDQVKPYLVISWKDGKSHSESFGTFFATAIYREAGKRMRGEG